MQWQCSTFNVYIVVTKVILKLYRANMEQWQWLNFTDKESLFNKYYHRSMNVTCKTVNVYLCVNIQGTCIVWNHPVKAAHRSEKWGKNDTGIDLLKMQIECLSIQQHFLPAERSTLNTRCTVCKHDAKIELDSIWLCTLKWVPCSMAVQG